jgi:tetratricopeptide (TPR) repeat protein
MNIKIICNLMIKNESSIIERCIASLNNAGVDAFCICDTGSTDDTVNLCERVLSKIDKPYIINTMSFKNFGETRTASFLKVQEFIANSQLRKFTCYALCIDADMVLAGSGVDAVKQFILKSGVDSGYMLIQKQSTIKYYNQRFLRCDVNWICKGATHEYWTAPNCGSTKIPEEIMYIDDKNDGGCKSDKYTRDLNLLIKELKSEPSATRTHFYLAQTLKDLGRYEDAIKFYEKRIALGGWEEEAWYSFYQICKCYISLKNEDKAEEWCVKAFERRPSRLEPLYFLINYFRVKNSQTKASKYLKMYHHHKKDYPEEDILFVEYDLYSRAKGKSLLDYEETILHYYISQNRSEGLKKCMAYINKVDYHKAPDLINNVWDNIGFYIEPMPTAIEKKELKVPEVEGFNASSCSIIDDVVNIRFVNYRIDENGRYILSPAMTTYEDNYDKVITRNFYYSPESLEMVEMNIESGTCTYDKDIQGVEDLRLFPDESSDLIYFSASSKNLSPNNNIEIVHGEYDISSRTLKNIKVLPSPKGEWCEKNWLFFNRTDFIYSWYPYKILRTSESEMYETLLEIQTTKLPNFFSRFRGSAGPIRLSTSVDASIGAPVYLCLIHFVKYSTPRKYYHALVILDENKVPMKYSIPFYFVNHAIEYCIGMSEKEGVITFFVSQNDCNPIILKKNMTEFEFVSLI